MDGTARPRIGLARSAILVLLLAAALATRRRGASPRARERAEDGHARDRRAGGRRPSSVVEARARRAGSRRSRCRARSQPFTDAAIYARTNGYLRKRYVDIGTAREAPASCSPRSTRRRSTSSSQQARADLATAEANARLAQTTAERYDDLMKTDSVSRQDLRQRGRRLRGAAGGGRVGARQRQAAEQLQGFSRSTRRSTA